MLRRIKFLSQLGGRRLKGGGRLKAWPHKAGQAILPAAGF